MLIPSIRKAATAAGAFLLLAPAYVYAAPATSTTSSSSSSSESTPLDLPSSSDGASVSGGHSSSGSLVRTIVGLAIVIAVIWGVTWVLKQVKQSRDERTRGTGLSTAAVVALGSGRSLHLIRAGREMLLVGVAENSVVPIRTYTEEEAHELGLDVPEDDDPSSSDGPAGGRPNTAVSALMDKLRERTVR
jgi:flagellar protein FliO/FliZ